MTTSIYWLDSDPTRFPDYQYALEEPNGLLAAGGDLTSERLLNAYSLGIFPWYNEGDPILWWSPDPRSIIIPKDFKPSKSLAKFMRKTQYTITINQSFPEVIRHCAGPRSTQDGTWINQDMMDAYTELHQQGHAHSIEYRINGVLKGGLYGLSIGRAFFGESMFSHSDNASKVAFHHLCEKLAKHDFKLIDCQVHNNHLASLGAKEIPRDDFLTLLYQAIAEDDGSCFKTSLSHEQY